MQSHSTLQSPLPVALGIWSGVQETRCSLDEDPWQRDAFVFFLSRPWWVRLIWNSGSCEVDRAGEQWGGVVPSLLPQRVLLSQLSALSCSMGTVSLDGLLPGVREQWMGFRASPWALGTPMCRVIFWWNPGCS